MKTESEIFENLSRFILREYWGKKDKLTLTTTIERDLGITGDDGDEFLEKFLKEFNIEYDKENFDPGKYFNDEGFGLINLKVLFGKKTNLPSYDLTLGHLVEIIKEGKWIEMK